MKRTKLVRYAVLMNGKELGLIHEGWTESGLYILRTLIGNQLILPYHRLIVHHF